MTDAQYALIKELFERMHMPLAVYAHAAVRDAALAEDLTQDTFAIACFKAHELQNSENREGWLMNVLKGVISNYRRTNAARSRIAPSESIGEKTDIRYFDDIEFEVHFRSMLRHDDFMLLKLTVVYGLTTRESAGIMGLSESACRKRLQRIKAMIKKNM